MKYLAQCLLMSLLLMPAAAFGEFELSTESLVLGFSDDGKLVSATACFPDCNSGASGKSPKRAQFGGESKPIISSTVQTGDWTLTPGLDGNRSVLKFESEEGATITWRIPRHGYSIELQVESQDTGPAHLTVQSGTRFRPRELAGFGGWLEQVRYVALPGRKSDFGGEQLGLDAEEEASWATDGWAGYRNRYWALLAQVDGGAEYLPLGGEGRQDASLKINVGGESQSLRFYLGPIEPNALAGTDPSLGDLQYSGLWFWLRWVCFGMLWLLGAIHAGISYLLPSPQSWGLSIILLSLSVHILMRPLSRIADRFQDQVHATEARLTPELNRIRAEHKGERQAEEIMALYKREGVHPLYSLKSLLGVAVVIPVFIGAFDMLAENIQLLGTPFLWIADLSRPDAIAGLPFDVPFFGAEFNLLPVLMTGLSVLASWLHRPPTQHPSLRRKQVRNMLLLAAAFFVLFYTFPSGMVLYWTTNNLISAAKGGWQHWRGNRIVDQDTVHE
jgi:YidC/Oxa1 family membrane protein insertase